MAGAALNVAVEEREVACFYVRGHVQLKCATVLADPFKESPLRIGMTTDLPLQLTNARVGRCFLETLFNRFLPS